MSASMGSSIIQSRSWHEYSGSNEPEQWQGTTTIGRPRNGYQTGFPRQYYSKTVLFKGFKMRKLSDVIINKQIIGGTPPCEQGSKGLTGQMTMMLHIYRPRWFQWTWFGVNRLSGCWVTVSTMFCLDERMNIWTDRRRQFHIPPFFFGKGRGQ